MFKLRQRLIYKILKVNSETRKLQRKKKDINELKRRWEDIVDIERGYLSEIELVRDKAIMAGPVINKGIKSVNNVCGRIKVENEQIIDMKKQIEDLTREKIKKGGILSEQKRP